MRWAVFTTTSLVRSSFLLVPMILMLAQCSEDYREAPTDPDASTNADVATTVDGQSTQDGQPGLVDASDASTSSDADSESSTPTVTCDLLKPFGMPTPLLQLNTADHDELARISPAGDELFLSRYNNAQPRRLFIRYTRNGPNAPWANPTEQTPLNLAPDGVTVTTATALALTQDGLTAFFQYYPNPGAEPPNVYASTRPTIGGVWAKPQPVTGLGLGEGPWLSVDDTRIYFFNNSLGNFHIFKADRSVNGFTNTVPLGLSTAEDRYPVLSVDEKTIYFAAYTLSPDGGPAAMNVYKATRALVTDSFGTATFVEELNYPGYFTAPSWLSKNGCTLLLSAMRPGGANLDILQAVKPP